jgi:hypothetical protein
MVAACATTCAVIGLMALLACGGGPTRPGETPLANGRWSGNGACLSVTDTGCDLTVGCGHGRFAQPTVRADGRFDVDGTYRIEVGPALVDPAPPAHFSAVVTRSTVVLSVTPSNGSPPASYSMTPATPGACSVPCV